MVGEAVIHEGAELGFHPGPEPGLDAGTSHSCATGHSVGLESIGGLEAPLRSLVGTLELTCGSAPRPGGSPHPTGQLRGASGKHRRKRGSVGGTGAGTHTHTHTPSQKNHGGGS